MKKAILSIAIALITIVLSYGQTTFCLQLTEVSNDGSNLIVKIEMQGSVDFGLGSSNLQFSYNTAGLSNPTLETSPLGPMSGYQFPTVTEPIPGEVSFNIELAFAGSGATIAATPGWTEIGQINFDIIDNSQTAGMSWSYNGGTTQTVSFLDDEATQIFATSSSTSCLSGIAPLPLPVELTYFQAELRPNQTTQLDWQTATELNNAGFEVERSQDARNWQKIGYVEGKGTTNEVQDYRHIDPDPQSGINYYRLKQIDYDGHFEYSPVRSVRRKGLGVNLFPNPVAERSELNVNFTNAPSRGTTSLRIFDISGQLMQQMPLGGQYNQVDIGQLPAGVYFVEVVEGRKAWQERLVVQ
jgi:hypothetical protein